MKKEFDFDYLKENMMGPNCVRILEELSEDFALRRGARVMDLGCGKGLTSMYLAEEFDAQVFATDLWIPATENFGRFRERGLDGRIVPIHADVHCRSLRCHKQAWTEWLQCDNPYAISDIDMMKAEGGKYFDTIGLIAEVK